MSGQNTSHAVMSQRIEPNDSLDFFPTPPWATRALCERLKQDVPLHWKAVWEPACGQGHMARPLAEYFGQTVATDVHAYGYGEVADFLFPGTDRHCDWIITNPPFRLAQQFALKAIALNKSVALLVRTAFLESAGRHSQLFKPHPPTGVFQFTERVPMHKGRLDPLGSTATAYCWIVWAMDTGRTDFEWIAPCRKRLERNEDYAQETAA